VPKGLHYDLWLGPAPYRPYHEAYLPAKWRGWWDFGGGTLADMACHYMDLPHWALGLRQPITIEAEGPEPHPESAPATLTVRYEHPGRGTNPPVNLTWYHGGLRPPHFADKNLKLPANWGDGVLFVGDKGMLLAKYGEHVLFPKREFRKYVRPLPSIPDSIGHHREWTEACKTGGGTTCNFEYAGALTETVLLGNVAHRTGKKLEFDIANCRVTNVPEAEPLIRKEYREGWTLTV
jgi:predicted dehydrogenase